jgi:hypothetical protein
MQGDRIAHDAQIGILNAGGAQRAPDIVERRLSALLFGCWDVDLKLEVSSAFQIQAQENLLRERQIAQDIGADDVRQSRKNAQE